MMRAPVERSSSIVSPSGTSRPDAAADGPAPASIRAGASSPALVGAHFDDFAALEPIREEWDAFVDRVGGDLFSTLDWCRVWWAHYGTGRTLHLVVVRDASTEAMAAALPLFSERIRVGPVSVRALRLVGCDHSVTSVAPAIDPARMTEALAAGIDAASRRASWDVIHLGPLPGYYAARDSLERAMGELPEVGAVEVRPTEAHMSFDVPETFDGFLAALSTKERRNVRRDERKLGEQGEIVRETVTDRAALEEAFDAFIDMHQAHWRGQGRLGHFADWPDAVAFHKAMVARLFERDRLMLSRVRVDGETIASEYGYVFGRRAHWILAARRGGVPGRIGFCGLVRHACRRGVREIDAMRGSYDYKRLLGARQQPQHSLVAVRRGTMPGLRLAILRRAARALDLAYYRAYFSRIAPKLPITPRPLWRSWIRTRF